MQPDLELTPLSAVSPLDGRYSAKLKPLRASMSEFGYMRARVQAEVAWFIALGDAGMAQFKPLSPGARLFLLELVKKYVYVGMPVVILTSEADSAVPCRFPAAVNGGLMRPKDHHQPH